MVRRRARVFTSGNPVTRLDVRHVFFVCLERRRGFHPRWILDRRVMDVDFEWLDNRAVSSTGDWGDFL